MEENKNIQQLNTFGISINAKQFSIVTEIQQIEKLYSEGFFGKTKEFLILGGGSNILFTENYSGVILKNEIKGIEIVKEDQNHCYVQAGSGEIWHEFVLHCIQKKLNGIENLSLIPGTVGAGPIQNIGAYGVELKDVFEELAAFDTQSGETKIFKKEDCKFGYRDSVFKNELKGRYFILSVTLKLAKQPDLKLSYGAIENTLAEAGIVEPTAKDVSQAVVMIRQSKLPDPAVIGNGGSFFKNPVISEDLYLTLKEKNPNIPHYPAPEGVKVPAGWLIDQCGWKGYKKGNIGVHKNQALVLVNYGGGSGKEIEKLSEEIKQSVAERFGIPLETEINIV